MKIRFYLLLPLLCATLANATIVWDGNSSAWTAGSGTEADPYLIETPQHLAWLSDMLTAKKSNYAGVWFRQTDDFDMNASKYTWVRIGSESYTFQGNYDGDSHTITNITGGLFGTLSGATVKNVTITNAIGTSWITKGNSVDYAGALAKRALSSTVSQCFNKSSITCSYYINMSTYVGGLIGAVEDCTLTRCGSEGDIVQSSSDNTGRYSFPTIGGLIGSISASTLTECYSKGDLRAQTVYCSVGGLVGAFYSNTQNRIVCCYCVGSVAGSRNDYGTIGGLIAGDIASTSEMISSMQNSYCVTGLGGDYGYGLCTIYHWTVTNSYFCNLGTPNESIISKSAGTERTESQIKAASFPIMLDENYFVADTYGVNNGYPIFTWQIPHYATITTVSDTKVGTVTGAGEYQIGEFITLTATPNTGYHFVRWSDGNTDNPRTIKVTGDTTLTAEFAINQYKVTLSANNADYGSVLGDGTYDYNTQVALTATPATGYHFLRWNDGNTDNPRTIFVISDTTLTAEFEKNVVLPSSGSAEVLNTSGRTSCEYVQLWENGPKWATFNVGATITDYADLQVGADATPYYNYVDQAPYYNTANVGGLYAWNQPNYNGRQTTWTESVTTGVADVATTLWGSNWRTPTKEQLDTLLNISGYYGKTAWTWCDGSITQYVPGCTLRGYKVTGVGIFSAQSIFLPAAGCFNYEYGSILHASNNGYCWLSTEYDSGSACLYFNSNLRHVNYDYDRKVGQSVRAVLVENTTTSPVTYTITARPNNSSYGSVTGGGTYKEGTKATLNAIPIPGYHFLRWSDGNTDNPRTITVTEDLTLMAVFEKVQNPSAEVLSTSGRTSCEYVQLWENGPKWATFNVGATITDYADLTIGADAIPFRDKKDLALYYNTANVGGLYAWQQPNYNARKTTWSGTVSTGAADVATALWGKNWKTPTLEQIDTLQSAKTTRVWCDGKTTQFVPGCTLVGYKISGVGAYADKSIFMPAAGSYSYSKGNVGSAGDWGEYWTNTAENGSEFAFLWGFNTEYSELAHLNREYALSVRAILAEDTTPSPVTYTITARPNNSSYGSVTGGGTYKEGTNATLNAVPIPGYEFVQWSDGNTDNPRTIIVTRDMTLTAEFRKTDTPTAEHEYVDLGLPSGTLWATQNMGLNDNFYAWGATSSSGSGTWENYRFGKSESSLTKYCVDAQYGANGFTDSKTQLEAADDAATKLWGEEWRIPTYEDWQELLACCTPVSEGYARELRSKSNGATIRFHLSGYSANGMLEQYERQGAYWSSDLYEPRCYDATAILFDAYNIMPFHALRCWGLSIRPVRKPVGKSQQSMSEDIETIQQEPTVVTKRIIDGTLYIIRDGHRYTTHGLLVE